MVFLLDGIALESEKLVSYSVCEFNGVHTEASMFPNTLIW